MVHDLVRQQGVETNGASDDEAEVEEMVGCVPGEHLVIVVVAEVVVEPKNGATLQESDGCGFVALLEGPGEGGEVDCLHLRLLPGTTRGTSSFLGEEETLQDVALRQGVFCLDRGRDVREIKRTRFVLIALSTRTLKGDGRQVVVIAVKTFRSW